jgi:hypothetical protein
MIKKRLLLCGLILILMLALLGCSTESKTGTVSNSNPQQGQVANKAEVQPENNNNGEIQIPAGWKELSQTVEAYQTDNWDEYRPVDGNKKISFSIYHPWKINSTVFYNDKDQKVAEIFPPVYLSKGQKPFGNWQPSVESEEKFISRKDINIAGLSGVKIITETSTESGIWYPHTYCLAKDDKAFIIAFYELKLNSGQEKLFDQIVSTLKIKDPIPPKNTRPAIEETRVGGVALGDDSFTVSSILGEPGKRKFSDNNLTSTSIFDGLEITFPTSGGSLSITEMNITSNKFKTVRGITVGSSKQQVLEAYGDEVTGGDKMTYQFNISGEKDLYYHIHIYFDQSDIVSRVQIDSGMKE